jgi:large subunit ribosomal protein L10
MNREEKQTRIEKYSEVVERAGYAILTEHGKMSVGAVERMRHDMDSDGCQAIFLKNTLARIVFEREGVEEICEYLVGPSLLFYGAEDVSPVARIVQKLARKNPALKVKAVLFDGKVYPSEDFKSFLSLPGKQELRAKFAGVIQAPAVQFVRVLNSAQRLAGVIQAFADKQSS